MTVNALRPQQDGLYRIPPYSEDDITLDPLILLRCDERVYRCPPLLQINLRILEAFLYASRTYLNEHTQVASWYYIIDSPSKQLYIYWRANMLSM